MSLIRFRGAGNTTIPVSTQDPLPVAVISGGGGGGGSASDVTIVGVQSGVVFNTTIGGVASGVTVPIALASVASGVTVPVAGRVRMETVSQSATFQSQTTPANITISGQNLHDFGGCIIHYELTNTYTVRLHGSFTAGGNAQEMVVAEATDITGRAFIVLPTFHVPNLRVEFVRTAGATSGQTNRVFIVLTPNMPV
jgi:hypothetical protein